MDFASVYLNPKVGYDGREFIRRVHAHQMLIRVFKNHGQCIPLGKDSKMNAFADTYQQLQFLVKNEHHNV